MNQSHHFNRLLITFVTISILLIMLVELSDQILSIHRTGRAQSNSLQNLSSINTFEAMESRLKHGVMYDENEPLIEKETLNNDEVTWEYTREQAIVYAMISASLVGLSGIVPLLILPNMEDGGALKDGAGAIQLKRLLSFAVGGLLGDVFLHLLPESWEYLKKNNQEQYQQHHNHWPMIWNQLWIVVGLISFCLLEKLFPDVEKCENENDNKHVINKLDHNSNENNNNKINGNGFLKSTETNFSNGFHKSNGAVHEEVETTQPRIKTSGYLNLLANCIDNFTHGLAVGASYLVNYRVGMLTTLAILLHEIPHEIGDFAILLRAGFDRWRAAKLQVLTAGGGLLGAAVALLSESAENTGDQVAWILPFTSGGFLYVALCSVVPDLLQETSPRESIFQIFLMLLAIFIMHGVSFIG